MFMPVEKIGAVLPLQLQPTDKMVLVSMLVVESKGDYSLVPTLASCNYRSVSRAKARLVLEGYLRKLRQGKYVCKVPEGKMVAFHKHVFHILASGRDLSEKLVLLVLAYHIHRDTSRCFPGKSRMLALTNLGETTFRNVTSELKQAGILKRFQQGKRWFWEIDFEILQSTAKISPWVWDKSDTPLGTNPTPLEGHFGTNPIPINNNYLKQDFETNRESVPASQQHSALVKSEQGESMVLLKKVRPKSVEEAISLAMAKKPSVKKGVNQLVSIWKELYPLLASEGAVTMTMVNLTGKQVGQLKLFLSAVGEEAPDILRFAMKNWMDVVVFVKSETEHCALPTIPNIGWLLTHAALISVMYAKEKEPAMVVKKKSKPTTKLLTLEELEAKWGGDNG